MLPFRRMGKSSSDKETSLAPGAIPRLQAEDLEQIVDRIVRRLRAGKPAHLPGLGTINPGKEWTFLQEQPATPGTPDDEAK